MLLPSKKTVDVTLEDKSDWQEIAVEQPAGAFEAVELKVKSVYAGKKYDDLCISDVQLFVTATSSDNPAFEKQRLEKIATWKKERVAAAKMFKTKLGQSLPIAPQYVAKPEDRGRQRRRPDRQPVPGSGSRLLHVYMLDRARHEAAREGKARGAARDGQRSGARQVRHDDSRPGLHARQTPDPDRRRIVHADTSVLRRGPVRERAAAADDWTSSATSTARRSRSIEQTGLPRSPTRSRTSRRSAAATSRRPLPGRCATLRPGAGCRRARPLRALLLVDLRHGRRARRLVSGGAAPAAGLRRGRPAGGRRSALARGGARLGPRPGRTKARARDRLARLTLDSGSTSRPWPASSPPSDERRRWLRPGCSRWSSRLICFRAGWRRSTRARPTSCARRRASAATRPFTPTGRGAATASPGPTRSSSASTGTGRSTGACTATRRSPSRSRR